MKIPLLDLREQYEAIKDEINKAVFDVLEAGQYVLGSNVKCLEEDIAQYCGAEYGVGLASGTDALVLTLDAWGIGPGDEVITTPYTFFATAEAPLRLGAEPVFVDVDPETYNIMVSGIEEKITPRTKAIIPVHLFGQPADMDAIMTIANKYNLLVLEDACQAIGAKYKGRRTGMLGHAAAFSFFPTKNLGAYGDGGMVVTNDHRLAEKLRTLRAHGSNKKYIHSILGYNSRLDEIQAAILRIKFKYLDQWNATRREKARNYDELLKDIVLTPKMAEWAESVYHLYIIRHPRRDYLISQLNENGIGTAIYYPVPLHLQEAFAHLGYKTGDLPVSELLTKETLALPLYPEITYTLQKAVADIISCHVQN